jgi:hypothetical protein
MATPEEFTHALDDMLFLTGVYRSMRCNAIEIQRDLARGVDPVEIARIANANVGEYKRLLSMRQAVRDDPELAKKLSAGLTAAGIDPAEHDALLDSLTAITDAQIAKPVSGDFAELAEFSVNSLAEAAAPVLVVQAAIAKPA